MSSYDDGLGTIARAEAVDFIAGQRFDLDSTSRSTAPELRPYQRDVIASVEREIAAGKRRVLLVAPTGSGKTVIAAVVVADTVARRERVLVLVHRRELVAQTGAKLYAAGVDAGIIQAGGPPMRLGQPVQVASIQTLHARAIRGSAIDLPEADLVVVDEAHHARARTWQRILESYPKAAIIGMTATPCRGDGRGLGAIFDVIVECPPVAELIAGGYLVKTTVYAPSKPDLVGVHIRQGDYAEGELAKRMDKPQLVGDVVEHCLKLAERRRIVVFASGVAHSVHLRDEFRRSGVMAEHLDGSTPIEERDRILAQLAAGSVEVVCNCMVLTEGWDQPEVSCLVLARPTKNMGLYRQMIGRGLRPAPGKTDCLVLDHAGAIFEHGFVDDPVEWTLREDRRATNPMQASRAQGHAPQLVTCPECSAIRFEGKPCPACGWMPKPKPRSVDVIDGELGRVERNRTVSATALDQRRFHGMLLYIAGERGYQRGWAAHKFKEKFGAWPSWRYAEPVPADDATRAWVRSRVIAFARAQAKQRGAA
jgi:DNA repair protein RadD